MTAVDPWFRRWFRAMPRHWQAGFRAALNGGAWLGEAVSPKDGKPGVCVLFLSPHLARQVEAFLTGSGRHELGECDPLTCRFCRSDLLGEGDGH